MSLIIKYIKPIKRRLTTAFITSQSKQKKIWEADVWKFMLNESLNRNFLPLGPERAKKFATFDDPITLGKTF